MSLRIVLTCGTCGGSGELGRPPSMEPDMYPCPDCVEGIPRTLIETGARAMHMRTGKPRGPIEPFILDVVALLAALRDRDEPHE